VNSSSHSCDYSGKIEKKIHGAGVNVCKLIDIIIFFEEEAENRQHRDEVYYFLLLFELIENK